VTSAHFYTVSLRLPFFILIALPLSGPVLAEQFQDTQGPSPADANSGTDQSPKESTRDGSTNEEESSVATLLDDRATRELHDDTTILRTVMDGDGVLLFNALQLWMGGAMQYDYYNFDDVFSSQNGGEPREGVGFRRLEGIFRAQLYDWGELKVQYDFDTGIMRDLYLRWVSERANTPVTITVGNQKEPMGMEFLAGNKFEMAQERSAPGSAFGSWRSRGVRLHKAFQLSAEERKLDLFDEDTSFMTTSVGVFTSDIEDSHATDVAVTGRITAGRKNQRGGIHVGLAGSYREGEFNRISPRPEVREADRVNLASPQANTQGIVAAELAMNRGRLHLQAEGFSTYYGGGVDGFGHGVYFQAGWFLTQDSRNYNPRWGILAPHTPKGRFSAEVFARTSITRGEDDINGWNAYRALTLGSTVTYGRTQTSINVVYGETREPVGEQQDGLAVVIRGQILF